MFKFARCCINSKVHTVLSNSTVAYCNVSSQNSSTSYVAMLQTSPDVFISYQWDKQPQIKALYKRLMSLGYTCWLDIMQMGGGDSLYDKIDRGVRGCKVVVSCATVKYALSANCRSGVSITLHSRLVLLFPFVAFSFPAKTFQVIT